MGQYPSYAWNTEFPHQVAPAGVNQVGCKLYCKDAGSRIHSVVATARNIREQRSAARDETGSGDTGRNSGDTERSSGDTGGSGGGTGGSSAW